MARGRGALPEAPGPACRRTPTSNSSSYDLYTAEVAAYYDPADGTFYIIQRDAPFGPVDKVTTAHEYTHALQDQHFDLEGVAHQGSG